MCDLNIISNSKNIAYSYMSKLKSTCDILMTTCVKLYIYKLLATTFELLLYICSTRKQKQKTDIN